MKKNMWSSRIILGLVLLLAMCSIHFSGRTMTVPNPDAIVSIRFIDYWDDEIVKTETMESKDDISRFLTALRTAKRTNIASNEDTPQQLGFTEVQLFFTDDNWSCARLFLYHQDDRLFAERPFDGIYVLQEDKNIIPH